MLIFGSFAKKTIKSYDFICDSHKKSKQKGVYSEGKK